MNTKKYGTVELRKDFGRVTFGIALESYRLGNELTQIDFAKKIGISPQSLCDLEKGRKIPSAGRAAKIAKKIKQPIEYWVELAIQDTLEKEHLKLKVNIKPAA